MNDKNKDVVNFGPVDPDYARRIDAAKTGAPPVGGAPMPTMPRFDQPPTKDRFAGVQPQTLKKQDRPLTAIEEQRLKESGTFIPGVGSAYAVNQPGVKVAPPEAGPEEVVNPPRPEGGLRPETVQQLAELSQTVKADETADTPLQEPVVDEVDYGEFGQRFRSLLNNKKRQDAIEKRITDLISIEDLIIHQEIRQRVPIIPGKFVPTYRTMNGIEDLWVKRAMGTETGSDTYITDKYAMMNLCCGLYAINSTVLPDHMKNGVIDDDLFKKKYDILLRYPSPLLADLSVNYVWFLRRAERAMVVDDIKVF